MPSPTVIRNFYEGGYYHIFNRGVEKRNIFMDAQDYNIFMYYLFVYLKPLKEVLARYPDLPIRLYNKNLNSQVDLLSYCLMPNHFHLLIRQVSLDGITRLLKQLTNAYTFYFNNKYKRVGGLVQGRFKAVEIFNDDLLLHVSRYIHLNPVVAEIANDPEEYKWSSYHEYVTRYYLCETRTVLQIFGSVRELKKFTHDQVDYAKHLERFKHLMLEK